MIKKRHTKGKRHITVQHLAAITGDEAEVRMRQTFLFIHIFFY